MLLYSLLMRALSPWLFFRLLAKSWKDKAYRTRIKERFCIQPHRSWPLDIWLHVVSLGEVNAALPLLNIWLKEGRTVLVTTTTPSGARQIEKHGHINLIHRYLPYDLSGAMRRFMRAYQPKVAVIFETEIWPNLICQAEKAFIPLILANACLSEKSYKGYLKAQFFFKPLFLKFSLILTQSTVDNARFLNVGAEASKLIVVGSSKLDSEACTNDSSDLQTLKQQWGRARPTFLLASTHEDEESQIIAHFSTLQEAIPGVVMLIAPRHLNRVAAIRQCAKAAGFVSEKRSAPELITRETSIVIIDSLGELTQFYAIADYAFVGGSLVPVGGHNVLEAVAAKVPVFLGKYTANIDPVCRPFIERKLMFTAENAQQLLDKIALLHHQPQQKKEIVDQALELLLSMRGVNGKYAKIIEQFL